MQQRIQNVITAVLEKWKSLEKRQQFRLIAVLVVFVITLAVTVYFVTKPQMFTLVKNEDVKTIAELRRVLTDANIYNVAADEGTSLQVNRADVGDARIAIDSSPLSTNKRFTYETALNLMGLGATESTKKDTLRRVTQSDIEASLTAFNGITDATVILTLPDDNEYYLKTDKKATAYAQLITTMDIDKAQGVNLAKAISRSVKGLDIKDIEIVDQNMDSIYSGLDQMQGTYVTLDELRVARKNEMDAKIKGLIIPMFDDVKVSTNLVLNTNTAQQKSITYLNPGGGDTGAVSKQVQEKQQVANSTNPTEPGLGANDQATATYQGGGNEAYSGSSSSQSTDYVFNTIERVEEQGFGDVDYEKSSSAIFCYKLKVYDEEYLTKNNRLNGMTWQDYRESLSTDVKIDVDPDIVEAIRKSTGINDVAVVAYELPVFKDMVVKPFQIEQLLMFGILALLILILAYGLIKATKPDVVTEVEPELSVEDLLVSTQLEEQKEAEEEAERMKQIELNTESEVKKQIERFVMDKPELVAQLLRNWLNEEWE